MSGNHEDPNAFDRIIEQNYQPQPCDISTPPWAVAIGDFPVQRQQVSFEAARIICNTRLRAAAVADTLFRPTFDRLAHQLRAESGEPPTAKRGLNELIADAAFLTTQYPDPGKIDAIFHAWEQPEQLEPFLNLHRQFLSMNGTLLRSVLPNDWQEITIFAIDSSVELRRVLAQRLVLQTLYGDRYDVWEDQQTRK